MSRWSAVMMIAVKRAVRLSPFLGSRVAQEEDKERHPSNYASYK